MSLFQNIILQLKHKFEKEANKNETFAEVITKVIGTKITAEQIILKKGKLFISVAPTVKLALLLKKEEILARCKEIDSSIFTIV